MNDVIINPDGEIEFIYDDALAPLSALGTMQVKRASHVEPAGPGCSWTADMLPIGGPVLGPFATRAEALREETDWLLRKMIADVGIPKELL